MEEFQDRFGLLPQPVQNLLYQLKIKILAIEAGITSIGHEFRQIVFRFSQGVVPPHIVSTNPKVRQGKSALWIEANSSPEDLPQMLIDLLHKLISQR